MIQFSKRVHILKYMLDASVTPKTASCRWKSWMHDHAFIVGLVLLTSLVEVFVTVITCR